MKITKLKQHYIDWESVGGYEKFMADYNAEPTYQGKRTLIESVPMQTNPEWLAARREHITASTMKDFLGFDRSGKKPGAGFKKVIKRLIAEHFGWAEAEATWNEKASIKRGLVFERRAVELFEQETGLKIKTDIGFVSDTIDDVAFGYSPDGYVEDENGKIVSLVEIKSFEMMRVQDELEILHSPDVCEQMQAGMMIADCPRCYKILYCAELDKIFYLKYTRGLDFKARLNDRLPIAKDYMKEMLTNLQYTDLTDKIMGE